MKDTLKSMTDFVLGLAGDRSFAAKDYAFANPIINYAQFLKQPLKLEMFVPCDEDGNVLEEPSVENSKYLDDNYAWNDYVNHHKLDIDKLNYQKAKEKVLFKVEFKKDASYFFKSLEGYQVVEYNPNRNKFYFGLETIEDLTCHNLELTESAIKQIYK